MNGYIETFMLDARCAGYFVSYFVDAATPNSSE